MRLSQVILFALLVPTTVLSADVVPLPKGKDDVIRLPLVTVDSPKPPPSTVTKLYAEQLYVIDSDVELRVLASPEGVVSVVEDTGPIKIRGKFVENISGKTTTRTIKGPFVYTVEPVTSAKVELLIVRLDGKGAVLRRTLDVYAGEEPRPPPKPPEPVPPKPPEPKPPDIKPVPVTTFRVFLVYESANALTPSDRSIIYGKVVEDWLNANCTGGKEGWRRRDKDAPGDNDFAMSGLWAAIQKNLTVTPCIAVEINGKVEIINTEATPAKMVEKLQSYKGGK